MKCSREIQQDEKKDLKKKSKKKSELTSQKKRYRAHWVDDRARGVEEDTD